MELIRKVCIWGGMLVIAAGSVWLYAAETKHERIGILILVVCLLLFFILIGGIIHWFIVKYQKKIKEIKSGQYLAAWQCPIEQWQRYQGEQQTRVKNEIKINYLLVGIIAPLFLFLLARELIERKNISMSDATIILVIASIIIVGLVWIANKIASKSIEDNLQKRQAYVDVYISANYVLMGQAFIPICEFPVRPTAVSLISNNDLLVINIEVDMSKRLGMQTVKVPVPIGFEQLANQVVNQLRSIHSIH